MGYGDSVFIMVEGSRLSGIIVGIRRDLCPTKYVVFTSSGYYVVDEFNIQFLR